MLGKGLESLIPPSHRGSPPSPEATEGHSEEQVPQEPEANSEMSSAQSGEAEFAGETPRQEETYSENRDSEATEPTRDEVTPHQSPEGEPQTRASSIRDKQVPYRAGEHGAEQVPNENDEAPAQEDWTVFQIEIDKIKPNPHQPRKYFNEESLRELAVSIREFGIIQPLVVSKIEKESERGWSVHYELITGERRLMASKLVGLPTVPAVIRSEPKEREKLELAVIENIQRTDLNAIELARAIARLQDEFGLTQREIATRLGKSRGAIANTVRLLGLPTEIQEAIAADKLSESHARLLLSIDNPAMQEQVFRDILRDNLNVRETDEKIKRARISAVKGDGGSVARDFIDPEIASLKEKLEEFLGTKVGLQSRGRSGKITINFYSPEELEAIVTKVTKQIDNQSPLPPLEP